MLRDSEALYVFMIKYILYTTITTLLLVSCSNTANKSNDSETDNTKVEHYAPGTRHVKISMDMNKISSWQEYNNAIDHYWDDFEFTCGERIIEYDTLQVMQAFAHYIGYLGYGTTHERCDSLLSSLIHRTEHSRQVFDFFAHITECVLHDPNSPLHNDEYYIPILKVMVESPLLDEYDRIAPAYDLEMASKNRVGHIANDIVYTLANGESGRLHTIDAEYIILMFSNPGCPMCRDITAQISASPLINTLMQNGVIKVLSVYPDEDLAAWREHLDEMPDTWIKSYDKGIKITQERTYNLNAIPSLYLLDRDKRVMIKDGVSVGQIENVIGTTYVR